MGPRHPRGHLAFDAVQPRRLPLSRTGTQSVWATTSLPADIHQFAWALALLPLCFHPVGASSSALTSVHSDRGNVVPELCWARGSSEAINLETVFFFFLSETLPPV